MYFLITLCREVTMVPFLILVPTEGSPPPTNSFLYNTPSFKINQTYKVQCCTVIQYQNFVLQNQSMVLYIVWKRFSAGQLVPLSGHLVQMFLNSQLRLGACRSSRWAGFSCRNTSPRRRCSSCRQGWTQTWSSSQTRCYLRLICPMLIRFMISSASPWPKFW